MRTHTRWFAAAGCTALISLGALALWMHERSDAASSESAALAGSADQNGALPQEARALDALQRMEQEFIAAADGSLVLHRPDMAAIVDAQGKFSVSPPGADEKLEMRTVGVRAGGRQLIGSPTPRVSNGTAELDYGTVTERIMPISDGVEQTWYFAESPGAGDLEVEVHVEGDMENLPSDGRGLRFASADGTIYRYGGATWIDAEGKLAAVAQEYVDGVIRMRVSADMVARSRFPAVLDPVVSIEHRIQDPVRALRNNPRNVAQATLGETHLIVWIESDGIYGMRMLDGGVAVDPLPFRIAQTTQVTPALDVAAGSDRFIVVWSQANTQIIGREVMATGPWSTVQVERFIRNGANQVVNPRVHAAHDGVRNVWAVIWEQPVNNSVGPVYGSTIKQGYDLTVPTVVQLADNSNGSDLACDLSLCVVAQRYVSLNSYFRVVRWNLTGSSTTQSPLNFGGMASAPSAGAPRIIYSSGTFQAAWVTTTGSSVRATRLVPSISTSGLSGQDGSAGRLVGGDDAAAIEIAPISGGLAIGWGSTTTFLGMQGQALRFFRLDWAGGATQTDARSVGAFGVAGRPTMGLSATAQGISAAYVEPAPLMPSGGQPSIRIARHDVITVQDKESYTIPVSGASFQQREVSAAVDRWNRTLVVWSDNRNGPTQVWAAVYNPDGSFFKPPFAIAEFMGPQSQPHASSGLGPIFLVTWRQEAAGSCPSAIYGMPLNYDANQEVSTPILLSSCGASVHVRNPVAGIGQYRATVLWVQGTANTQIYKATLKRNTDGSFTTTPPALAGGEAMNEDNPAIAEWYDETVFAWDGDAGGQKNIYVKTTATQDVKLVIPDAQYPALATTEPHLSNVANPNAIAWRSRGQGQVRAAYVGTDAPWSLERAITVSPYQDRWVGRVSIAHIDDTQTVVAWRASRSYLLDNDEMGVYAARIQRLKNRFRLMESSEVSHLDNSRSIGVEDSKPTTVRVGTEAAIFYTYPDRLLGAERITYRFARGLEGNEACTEDAICISGHCSPAGICCEADCLCGNCDSAGQCIQPNLNCLEGTDYNCDSIPPQEEGECLGEPCDDMGRMWTLGFQDTELTCACPGGVQESSCSDGVDNNCDGLVDCQDSHCAGEACGNGSFCSGNSCVCQTGLSQEAGALCADGLDNDCDGLRDCEDPDCRGYACDSRASNFYCTSALTCECQQTGWEGDACDDGIDNDCSGQIDCEDHACDGRACGEGNYCDAGICLSDSGEEEVCDDGVDNDKNGYVDCKDDVCADAICAPGMRCVESQCVCDPQEESADAGNCGDGIDNDCNGQIDCADETCREGQALCYGGGTCGDGICICEAISESEESEDACINGLDDDCNALIDCEDSGCDGLPCLQADGQEGVCVNFVCSN